MQRLSKWRHLLPALSLPYVLALSSAMATPDAAPAPAPAKGQPFAFHDGNVLGTSMDLQVTAASQADADKTLAAVHAEIDRLSKILSTYDPATDISKVNATRTPVAVSPELIAVLRLYEQWQIKTKGAYTAGLGEVVKLWKQAEKDGKAPDAAALKAVAAEIHKPLWRINDAAHTVERLTDQTLNVDSLGKGFIVSHAAQYAKAQVPAIKGLLLNIGGDIATVGSSSTTGMTPWQVAVADPAHPEDNAAPLTTVNLSAMSVATSGNYARGYEIGDKKYSHLLDPRTGAPVDFAPGTQVKVVSATAIAADNAAANALATSLCILTPAEGLALAKSSGAECLLVMSDGTQQRSPGFAKYEPAAGKVVAGGAGFANGYQVSVALQLKPLENRAYCAVWIEDNKGQYVKTLAIWGNEKKYLPTVATWWKLAQKDKDLAATATRATRAAGSYPLAWDGTDDKGKAVPPGSYKVFVETSAEHAGHQKGSAAIACGDAKSTATIDGTPHFEDVALTYAPKGN